MSLYESEVDYKGFDLEDVRDDLSILKLERQTASNVSSDPEEPEAPEEPENKEPAETSEDTEENKTEDPDLIQQDRDDLLQFCKDITPLIESMTDEQRESVSGEIENMIKHYHKIVFRNKEEKNQVDHIVKLLVGDIPLIPKEDDVVVDVEVIE